MSVLHGPAVPPLEAVPPTVPAGRVARDLARRVSTLVRAARRLHKHQDARAAHDVRVAARRLEAALELWEVTLDETALPRLRKRLRKIRRAASGLRDLEAGIALLRTLAPELDEPVRQSAEAFALRLERRVPEAAADAAPAVKPARLRQLKRRFARAVAPLHGEPGAAAPAVPLGAMRDRALALAHQTSDALRAAHQDGTDEAFHEARLALKRRRYLVEGLAAVDRMASHEDLAGLRDLQRSLGRLQDLATLMRRVERRAAKRRVRGRDAGGLEALLAALRTERAQARAAVQDRFSTGNGVGAPRTF